MTNNTDFEDSSLTIIKSILKLLLKLLVVVLKATGKYVGLVLIYILAYSIKFAKRSVKACKTGYQQLKDFWNDNDTQHKVRKIRINTILLIRRTGKLIVRISLFTWKWVKIGASLSWHWTKIGSMALAAGTVWLIANTWQSLIHLRTTTIRLIRISKVVIRRIRRWYTGFCRRQKAARIRRQRRYQEFKRTKGFKGLLIDIRNSIIQTFNNFIDEDQTDENDAEIIDDLGEEILDNELQDNTSAATSTDDVGAEPQNSIKGKLKRASDKIMHIIDEIAGG